MVHVEKPGKTREQFHAEAVQYYRERWPFTDSHGSQEVVELKCHLCGCTFTVTPEDVITGDLKITDDGRLLSIYCPNKDGHANWYHVWYCRRKNSWWRRTFFGAPEWDE